MIATQCPPHASLEAYLHGDVDDAGLDEHLDACSDCQRAFDRLDAELNLAFARLRESAEAERPDSTFDSLVAGVKTMSALASGKTPVQVGDTIGNYQILELIAHGGMGDLYKAQHLLLKKTVALKMIRPYGVRSADSRQRFQREMEAVGRLTSPHIVTALDANTIDGIDFLAMEFIDGDDLRELVHQRGPLPIPQALDCIMQAARGLAHAHEAGIVHRDVKPSNLILDKDGIVKVLDLGLARLYAEEEPGVHIMGTPAFMAPEQAADTSKADARADIYSLGCTLHFLLTGAPPHAHKSGPALSAAHCEDPVPSVRAARPDCPRNADALVQRMLAKKPADRPASMREVCVQSERLLARSRAGRWVSWRTLIAASILLAIGALGSFALWSAQGTTGGDPPKGVIPKKDATPAIDMVRIPSGEFWMGASETDKFAHASEKPRRKIRITRAFFLGKTEVTQAQYEEVMGTNPAAFSKKGQHKERVKDVDTSRHPVESVSWLDAVRFCNRLSERHELEPYYKIEGEVVTIRGGVGYRLPTEAEWEHASRGGESTTWSFGESAADLKEHAWYDANSGDRTHPVGEKKANPFGLFDMLGNVPEWCWDRYEEDYYKRMPSSDPAGAGTGRFRVHRGDAWNSPLPRSSARSGLGLTYGSAGSINIIGLRLARNAEQ